MTSTAAPIVIVGSGLAGYTATREFRQQDKDTHFSADDGTWPGFAVMGTATSQKQALAACIAALLA